MSSLSNSKKIIEAWIEKGDLENDNFSKFICYWVAFNCWLYTTTSIAQDNEALKNLYSRPDLYQDFQNLVARNQTLLKNLSSICPIANNRTPSRKQKKITTINNFQEVMDVIYEIRCNLFHGSKADTDNRDVEVIGAATPVLELVVKNICH